MQIIITVLWLHFLHPNLVKKTNISIFLGLAMTKKKKKKKKKKKIIFMAFVVSFVLMVSLDDIKNYIVVVFCQER